MAAPSLRINNNLWEIDYLNEHAFILIPAIDGNKLEQVHQLYRMFQSSPIEGIIDVVPAYENLTVFWDASITQKKKLLKSLVGLTADDYEINSTTYQVQVDYTEGLDWDRVEQHTGLNKAEIIQKHTETTYKVAMIGFLPGFIFLDGLDPALSVPRLTSPRTSIPAGSVGIGGAQTGLYSLPSAGGWNIIGTTKHHFFDETQKPPINLIPGDFIKFVEVA